MFGVMAYLTSSILPGIVVHSAGLLIFFTLVWPFDSHRRLVWQTGASAESWIYVALAIIFTALAILAFRQLARATKPMRAIKSQPMRSASANKSAR